MSDLSGSLSGGQAISGSLSVGSTIHGNLFRAVSIEDIAFQKTLQRASWSQDITITIHDSRFLTGQYAYVVSANQDDIYAWQDADVYADNVTVGGQMTFHADEFPVSDLVANIVRMGAVG